MAAEPFLLIADALLPMSLTEPSVLRNAGVVIAGDRITAIGELSDLRRQYGDLPATRQRVPGVLLPGLINAHTHLELSTLRGMLAEFHQFPEWVDRLLQAQPEDPTKLEALVRASVQQGIKESLAAGVTTVGDISRHVQFSRPELAASSLRAVSFGEVVGLGSMRERAATMLDAAISAPEPHPSQLVTHSLSHLVNGIAPHAPYTVEGPTLRAAIRRAIIKRAPLAMHLAEHREEADFLRDLSGPLGREWSVMQRLNVLDDKIPRYAGGPIRWAQMWGLLISDPTNPQPREAPVILAHLNYCDNAELAQVRASHASVAYCPRTHAFFRHAPHRFRDMLDYGINVCLATDSLASNPDLSVLKEAQLLHQRDGVAAQLALDMITRRAALALGLGEYLGSLQAGLVADVVHLPLASVADQSDDQLVNQVVSTAPAADAVWIDGLQVL